MSFLTIPPRRFFTNVKDFDDTRHLGESQKKQMVYTRLCILKSDLKMSYEKLILVNTRQNMNVKYYLMLPNYNITHKH